MTTDSNNIKSSDNNSSIALNDTFVDMKFITDLIQMSNKWVYKQIKLGLFPQPIKFGRSSRWSKKAIEQWLQNRIEESLNA